jgi:hypothetical protein
MFLEVRTLSQTKYYVPYYGNMPWRKYLTHVVAPHLNCPVAENGDVHADFMTSAGLIFKGSDQDVLLKEILKPSDIIYCMMITNVPRNNIRGNGCLDKPTRAEYHWVPSRRQAYKKQNAMLRRTLARSQACKKKTLGLIRELQSIVEKLKRTVADAEVAEVEQAQK